MYGFTYLYMCAFLNKHKISQLMLVGVNPKSVDDYAILEWKNLTKLHIFAGKHNTYIGQHIQWKTISLRWLCIDLELTPSEIMTSRETQEYFPVFTYGKAYVPRLWKKTVWQNSITKNSIKMLKQHLYIQLIQLRLTSSIVKCVMWSIECQKNDDSLHANVKNIIL